MCNQKSNMLETEQKDIKTVYNVLFKVYFVGNFDINFFLILHSNTIKCDIGVL